MNNKDLVIKFASICGVILAVMFFITFTQFYQMFLYGGSLIFLTRIHFLIIELLFIFFYIGFLFVGKKYNDKMVSISSWMIIILSLIYLLLDLVDFSNFYRGFSIYYPLIMRIMDLLSFCFVVYFGVGVISLNRYHDIAASAGIFLIAHEAIYISLPFFNLDNYFISQTTIAIYMTAIVLMTIVLFKSQGAKKPKRLKQINS